VTIGATIMCTCTHLPGWLQACSEIQLCVKYIYREGIIAEIVAHCLLTRNLSIVSRNVYVVFSPNSIKRVNSVDQSAQKIARFC